jgi:hypothetical protein
MKLKLRFLLKVLLYFLPLYLLQDAVAALYQLVLQSLGTLLFSLEAQQLNCNDACLLRVITYLALVMATPQLGLSRRLLVLLAGLTVFFCIDLTSVFFWPAAQPLYPLDYDSFFLAASDSVWRQLSTFLLPVLVWIIVADRSFGLFGVVPDSTDRPQPGLSSMK